MVIFHTYQNIVYRRSLSTSALNRDASGVYSLSSIITGDKESHYFKCDHDPVSRFPVDYAFRLKMHANIEPDEMLTLDLLADTFSLQQHVLQILPSESSVVVTVQTDGSTFV